ncbi:hypothetical protein, variant [Aphanomyces astaci]|uniref:Uncharacterized protein n=1 Tax=Aphanomyces astaci TaxID=112090 RepID=W4FU77_APHAT|nr:hypothetical protein, variant [Aphanomyces astaci]ETV70516.1 hypothetical protein, variant [Aphanomyces astaci]|eukprot:XP_009839899.1 hypothetical protein, variant [Aphanomyces astaci]
MDNGPTVVGGGAATHDNNNGLVLDTTLLTGSNALGLWITISAGICSNLGVQLQKHAHQARRPRLGKENNSVGMYFAQKQWIVGMALVLVGSIGDFEALSFATQSLVATVGGGTTVVTNVLFSTIWHGEHFTIRDAYGTFCILLGVLLIALCSPQDEQYNVEQLVYKFQSPSVVAYLALVAALLYVLHAIVQGSNDSDDIHIIAFPSAINACRQTSARLRRFIPVDTGSMMMASQESIQPVVYAIMSGIMGSLSMLLGKCASEMLQTTFQGSSQFNHPVTYLFFTGMVATIGLQVHWFNQSLMRGDMAIVFPVFQVFWIGFGVVGGMVLYGDLARLEFFQGVSFVLAFWCILIGVYNLAQHESQGVDASPSPNLVRPPNLPPSIGSTAANSYLVDAYQTLLESHVRTIGVYSVIAN